MEEQYEPVEIPITDVFDLHSIPPRNAKDAVEAYLEEAHRKGLKALRIIHGRGIGVQREMVRRVLSRTGFVKSFSDAPVEAGGWGATIVTLYDERTKEEPMIAARELGEELSDLAALYEAVLYDAESLAAKLSKEQFNWREQPGRWSVGECLDHLCRLDGLYAGRISKAIERGRREREFGTGPFKYGWLESYMLRNIEPPAKFRVKSPKAFRPAPELDPKETLGRFRTHNRRLRELVREAAGLNLRRIQVSSPVTKLWKWSLGVALAACVAHDRRHIHQALQVKAHPDFPR
ncbi:MAG: DinB family protein [Acidobacteria bacterium]|nr:DinB family protein [Acidobacteriota bacterium]